ncbi:MAG: glycosyltransferase family 39 protein [Candidatus Omnitrophota bacterium]|jgi:4-amino-4-deoxy-L-arabinose transferase-like glycosyltransferase
MKKVISIALAIFAIALLPRLYVALSDRQVFTPDSIYYNGLAGNILEGKGFSVGGKPTTFKEPFYPFFLAAVYHIFGNNYAAVKVIQAIIGALTCVIIFMIARRLFDAKTAVLGALIGCFYPAFIRTTELMITELLYTFLLISIIFFLLRYIQGGGYGNLAFCGAALGIASLTRSVIVLLPVFILLLAGKIFLSQARSVKKYIISAAILLAFFILPIAPWTVRNWKVAHRFIPISTTMGIGLYSSYVPKEGKLYGFIASDEVVEKSRSLGSEAAQSDFLAKEALKYIKNNPLRVLKLEVLKTVYFWSVFDWEILGNGVYNYMYAFIMPFFILGIFVNSKRSWELAPVYLPIIYSFCVSLVFYGSPRFRLPIEPYIIMIGAAGIFHFIRRSRNKILPGLLISGYFMLNVCFYAASYETKVFFRSIFQKIGLW